MAFDTWPLADPHTTTTSPTPCALIRASSSAVALLLEIQRWAKAASRPWRVANAPAQLQALIQVYGLDEVLALPVA